ncbi:hypothetical protein GCM10010334_22530 [Streptomyces finlayi]|uniref:Uncharacterized protein n=2 Tax=Streptomyces finlayi TaxID=67296 RepID=A0A919C993_9ACTN|nr:hypothetical protein GCM10010334_22530 [Streptomyces finlayi]
MKPMKNIAAATVVAALAAAGIALAVSPSASDASTASDRETGTVKPTVQATAGDKKVEVIKA